MEVPCTVKRPEVVALTKLEEVAKRLDEVLFVVEAFVAAKSVAVALVRVALSAVKLVVEAVIAARRVLVLLVKRASVAVSEEIKALVKVSPVPEILVVLALPR